jgi:hypothetical protein
MSDTKRQSRFARAVYRLRLRLAIALYNAADWLAFDQVFNDRGRVQ